MPKHPDDYVPGKKYHLSFQEGSVMTSLTGTFLKMKIVHGRLCGEFREKTKLIHEIRFKDIVEVSCV